MTRTEMLLIMVMEECDEVSQRAAKALRFTLDEVQAGQELTNAERICYEFNDLLAVIDLLRNDGKLEKTIDPEAIKLKKAKVEKWLSYSESVGTMSTAVETCEICGSEPAGECDHPKNGYCAKYQRPNNK